MKLIYCKNCGDIVKLNYDLRYCDCANSSGRYIDKLNAEYYGDAIPLGIANNTFKKAISSQPNDGMGKVFSAFVIPKKCDTFIKI